MSFWSNKRNLVIGLASVVLVGGALAYIISKNKAQSKSKFNPAFSAYISGFTGGIISKESTIMVRFQADLCPEGQVGLQASDGLFDFSPGIEGQAYWLDNNTLEFRPTDPLKTGTKYEATLHLGKLVNVPDELKDFEFVFETLQQGVSLQLAGISYPNISNLSDVAIEGTVTVQDKVDNALVEKALTATQESKALTISWKHESELVHSFVIKGIVRSNTDSEVLVACDGKVLEASESLEETVAIPALGTFNVLSTDVVHGEEQYVSIVFSDPLDQNQNLDGLVTIQNSQELRLVMEENRLKAYPNNRLTGELDLIVYEGIKNILGQRFSPTFTQKLSFDPPKPAVRILGKGTILPGTHQMQLPFEAIGLKAVDIKIIKVFEKNVQQFFQVNNFNNEYGPSELKRVGQVVMKKTIPLVHDNTNDYAKWKRFAIDLSDFFKAEPGAIYQVTISFKKDHTAYACDGVLNLSAPLASLENEEEIDTENNGGSYDFYEDYYPEDYDYRQRENPCHNSYYAYDRTSVKRLVFASDLGIIAKRGKNGEIFVAVTNMLTTEPISGAQVELYDYQHQILGESSTDNNGWAKFSTRKSPFFLIVKDKEQRGYLRLDDPSALPLNYFDVAGATVEKGLTGFLYAERSVWRPGDSLFVSFMLESKQQELPSDIPVVFELTNPQGVTTSRKVASNGVNGLYTFLTSTPVEAPTGRWGITAKVGGVTFSLPVRIETIMPNRLRMNIAFAKDKISSTDRTIDGKLSVQWLTGLTASNLKTEIEMGLVPMETTFKNWSDYTFEDISKNPTVEKQIVFDEKIDENGNADLSAESPAGQALFSGFVKANFRVKVSENGGASSTDRFSVPLSPYSHYVGIKMPVTDKINRALKTDEYHAIEIGTVTENGVPANRDIEIKVYKLEWRWWWDNTETFVYMDESYMRPIQQTQVKTSGGKGTFSFRINYPEWGRYLILAKDRQSGHSSSSIAYVDWPGYGGSSSDRSGAGASVMSLSVDKEEYAVGDEIKLQIPSTIKGRALVSIET
ncbi:MAG: hypothetical protein K2Q22_02795, partial [Cytophagales bacterium]|nr:hypothetical protein [Cytophagales bacterium]